MRAEPSKLFNPDPGGQAPIRSDVSRGAVAATSFAARRDLPDVLGFEDVASAPSLTHEVLLARVSAGTAFADAVTFPLPKGEGKATRPMTVMNPFDELLLRAYVGRCSSSIRAATDATRVLNGLIEHPGPGWYPMNVSAQYQLRTRLRQEYYDRPETRAVGFFDAKEFFCNCAHSTAAALLDAAGAPPGAIEVIVNVFRELSPSGVGLPIGFEGSGPIANLFFARVDEELAARGIPSLRWTDDLDTFLPDVTLWPEIHQMVEAHLLHVGIPLNPDKTGVMEKGDEAFERLFDPSRDSVFMEDDPTAAAEDRFDLELAMEDIFGLTTEPPAPSFRSRLRALRRGPSTAAVEFLESRPHWFDREPRAVGDYLCALATDSHAHAAINRDWLMDRAVGRTPTPRSAAGQLHACRVLAAYRVDKVEAKALKTFAYDLADRGEYLPLGAWAVRAYSESRGWKRQGATDLIHDVDHQGYRRAAVMGFTGMPPVDRDRSLESIRRAHPEVGPVTAFVAAGAKRGSALP